MEIAKVCELVNQELAGELLREDELMLYLDKTIDAIKLYMATSSYIIAHIEGSIKSIASKHSTTPKV